MAMAVRLTPAMFVAYPLVSHLAIRQHAPLWLAGYLILLGLLQIVGARQGGDRPALGMGLGLMVAGGLLPWLPVGDLGLFYGPPLLIIGGLLVLFASSLLPGREPLISRIAEFIDGAPLSAEKRRYTRTVTVVWSGFFVLLLVELLWLGRFASLEVWSWFANVFNYGLMGLLMTGEYLVRRRRFGAAETGSPGHFLRQLVKCRHIWTKS